MENILIVMRNYGGFGGVEKVVDVLIPSLIKNKVNVSVADFNDSGLDIRNEWGLPILHLLHSEIIDSEENIRLLSEFIKTQKVRIIISQGYFESTHNLLVRVKKRNKYEINYCFSWIT